MLQATIIQGGLDILISASILCARQLIATRVVELLGVKAIILFYFINFMMVAKVVIIHKSI
jgi:hypothetical protein